MKKVWLLFFLGLSLAGGAWWAWGSAPGSWRGVDETVVEAAAATNGRASIEPLINTDQGDLLLFCFLVAGLGGGFVMGYFYRGLISQPVETPRAPSL